MKKLVAVVLVAVLALTSGCEGFSGIGLETGLPSIEQAVVPEKNSFRDASLSPEARAQDLLSRMTLEEKAGQMVQAGFYAVTPAEMMELNIGSVLSGGGGVPQPNTVKVWQEMVDSFQQGSMASRLSIPYFYGIDAVHGHSNIYEAVIFPHNIGLGAANDPEKMYEMGAAVAEEMKLTHTLWNFSPCVAVSTDPRWGRTYESFSSETGMVTELSLAYLKGQLDAGVIPTAKHYVGDGGVVFGTGEREYLIDRGDVQMDEAAFREKHLAPYQALIEAGVPVIMASFSSYQGEKMTQSKYFLTTVLKDELGFEGFVVSDWEAVSGLSGESFSENVCLAVNAGVDMLMEAERFREARQAIIDGVNDQVIDQSRVDDAVLRILKVKFAFGLFEDPYMEKLDHKVDTLGSASYRELSKSLVEESLVLLKNDKEILPLKSGQKIFVTGPAANDIGAQCGGWTMQWQGVTDNTKGEKITVGTTILEGLVEYGATVNIEFFTDPARISEADAVIIAVGEEPYAEYEGDSKDLDMLGNLGLPGNKEAIDLARQSGKPVIALIVAGRHIDIDAYLPGWNAAVMCYLPGTEGDGVASVLTGEADFTGKLPSPWYKDIDQIGTEQSLFSVGYGLSYK